MLSEHLPLATNILRVWLESHASWVHAGVSVVGATSRPDLLDAALLRPGRLDRLLLCGFPDAEERVAIARALAGRLTLAPDAQLDAMAAGAQGFTGDLPCTCSDAVRRAWNTPGAVRLAASQAPRQTGIAGQSFVGLRTAPLRW